ncbi:MFS transporter, FHS family, L-fucose permease, partial [Tremellales sp. Uapishka_1]
MLDYTDRGPAAFTVTLVTAIIATVFVLLRMISKWGVTRRTDLDDWFTISAWALAVALAATVMGATKYGLGLKDADILPQWEVPLKSYIYGFTVLYNPSLMLTKTAILILYIRMAVAHPFLRHASIATLLIVNIAGTVLTFLNIFRCHPIRAAFTHESGQCLDTLTIFLAAAPINIATDLAILVLPLPILTSLRLEFRQKVVLVATFVVGGFVTVVDVVRVVYLQDALKEALENGTNTNTRPNAIYHVSFGLMWSSVEVNAGLVCCSVLVMKPLVMKVIPALLYAHGRGSHSRSRSQQQSQKIMAADIQPQSPDMPIQSILSPPENDEDGLDIFQFFSNGPPESAAPQLLAEPPATRNISRHLSIRSFRRPFGSDSPSTQHTTKKFTDFVNMTGHKPLTELSNKESLWPVLFVTILFFLWGFAYGLIGTLNGQIQPILGFDGGRAIALNSSYWLGYFIGSPTIGYYVLTRFGFKATFITGLFVLSVGCISFWPSAVLMSYPGFVFANIITAIGLACLEVAANPFIAIAGPGEYCEARLLFAQGVQAIGTLLSSIIAEKALFRHVNSRVSLYDVQWCYLAVAMFVVFLSTVFFYFPLGEASAEDLQEATRRRFDLVGIVGDEKTLGIPTGTLVLVLGIATMTLVVGAQEDISGSWTQLVAAIKPGSNAFWDKAIYHAVFAVARFFAAGLAWGGVRPRLILAGCFAGSAITTLLAMLLPPSSGALACLLLVTFFEAPTFPALFAIVLRGQGSRTKLASTALITAIVGGAIYPPIVYKIDMSRPTNPRYALRVTIVIFFVSMLFTLILSSKRSLRRWVDPLRRRDNVVPLSEVGLAEVDGNGLGFSLTLESSEGKELK